VTLNLNTVELETTLRPFAENGAPASNDYNDQMMEILTDLASITEYLNDTIRPILSALPASAALPLQTPVGIEARTIFTDTSNQTPLYYDVTSNTALTIAQTIALLNGMIQGATTQIADLVLQVTTLSSQLSVSNQNLLLQSISSLTSSLSSLQAQVDSISGGSGSPGTAATITVGSTTTGAAGSEASVSNSGTSSAAILDFVVPQGATGATGPAGPTGPAGTPTAPLLNLISGVAGMPTAGQEVLLFIATAAISVPANFAGSVGGFGVHGHVPTATATYLVWKNTTQIGMVTISTGGVFAFTTTGGLAQTINIGDVFSITAPGTQDATLASVVMSLQASYS